MTHEARSSLSRTRLIGFAGAAIVLALIGTIVAAEVALRALRRGAVGTSLDIVIEPGGRYQVPDSVLGFRPIPGSYTGLFDHRHLWHFTILPDTTRITRPLATYDGRSRGPGVWVFGCSFVQGWGLDDEGTSPWKLQERLPEYDVVNFGVGGYGTLQSLLQLQQALRERSKPRVAILAYASFHDERNTRSRAWRDANYVYGRFGTTAQPYARLDRDGQLRLGFDDGSFPFMWLRTRSRLFESVVRAYGVIRDSTLRSHEVSARLIEQFAQECRRQGVRFVLVGIWPSEATSAMIRRFAATGTDSADISVSPSDPANVIEYDGHPSATANERYAERTVTLLRQARIID